MPNFTPNLLLPYPNGGDAPCDFAEQWCAFTARFQVIMDGFQDTIDRTATTIPMAQMRRTVPKTYTANTVILDYDAVPFDTAGFTNFDASTSTIKIDRAGVFVEHVNTTTSPNTLNSTNYITAASIPSVYLGVFSEFLDRAANVIGNYLDEVALLTVQTSVYSTMTANAAPTVQTAVLTSYWHADTVRP